MAELISVNYKLCSHCGPTKEDIPTLQSDVITKVRRTSLCVIHPTANADWWPCPVKTPWDQVDEQPPPLSFLLNFLPPKVLSISIPAQAPMWPSVFRYKAIDNLDHQAVMAGLAYHSQSRLYHFTLPCRAKKYDSLSEGGRKGWALESCRRGGEGLIWHSSLGLP